MDDSFLRCLDDVQEEAKNQDDDDYSILRCLEEIDVQEEAAKNQDDYSVQEDALNDDYSFLQCLEEEAKNQEVQDAFNLQNLLCLDVPTDVLNDSFYQELIQDKKRTYSSMSEEDEDDDGCQKKPRCNSFEHFGELSF